MTPYSDLKRDHKADDDNNNNKPEMAGPSDNTLPSQPTPRCLSIREPNMSPVSNKGTTQPLLGAMVSQ